MNSRRAFQAACLALSVAAFTGCASLPSPEKMKAETANFQLPKQPEAGKALVYVVRPSSVGGLIRFNVFVDDQQDSSEMGYTRANQHIFFNLTPGSHKIMSKAENWAELPVDVKAGQVIFVQQEPSMGFVMARNALQQLDDISGKYYVKTTELGTVKKQDK